MSQINETAIRTPGVYTTEIPTLPPSVAQVSTAVPAFIGYTQKNIAENGDSLLNLPTKIFSLKEYEQNFGFAENEEPPSFSLFKKAHYHLLRLLNFTRYTHSSITNFYPQKITSHIYKAGYHDCTHAYAITQSAAQKLLQLQQPIGRSEDLRDQSGTNYYCRRSFHSPF